ncbi:fatty acid desaturase family protein [Acidiphilium iwatense]|uniref:Fatty acid desaturase family protein n=2 Tax=Acidiphilium iwatense TaxID=768198 RepID=A0ABS9DZD2_9PROT|nr:fatty acid desaturase family protein [Acidiphilium sp. AL]MCF3948122.1 fatty acid desaturase family protein [Acidiphilium iwatense]
MTPATTTMTRDRPHRRDYGLTGADARRAEATGLANAKWFSANVPRAALKSMMQRRNGPALRDTAIWLAALAASGGLAAWFWGSAWSIPFFGVYGVLYGSASDSRWHECGHGTAFRTRRLNDIVYNIASFMILREPTVWRWSHARHHTDTIIVGRDPEILAPRPPDLLGITLNLFALKAGPKAIAHILLHATGCLTADEKSFIPATEQPKVIRTARIWLGLFGAVIALALATRSFLPLMLVGLPTFYGAWLQLIFGVTQHSGLAEDVLDHRLNSRTIHMNPVFRFIYWNMNYHVEHHMFPLVPYHALPQLHAAIGAECPPPYPGLLAAYREIVPALIRQRRDPTWHIKRRLPQRAVEA